MLQAYLWLIRALSIIYNKIQKNIACKERNKSGQWHEALMRETPVETIGKKIKLIYVNNGVNAS